MAKKPENPVVRFMRLVIKDEQPDGCWMWCGARRGKYGTFSLGRGRNVSAHRYSWEIHNGPVPEGLEVLHECDRPLCVNPAHLFVGTQSDNVRDCVGKGRHVTQTDPMKMGRPGEVNGKAILTDDLVREIRRLKAEGMRNRPIARKFGLRDCLVSQIVNRVTWKHVQ
jgi:hypothetical protein